MQAVLELAATFEGFVGLLFLYSGTAKLLALRQFSQTLLLIPYLPHRQSRPIAVGLACAEVLAGAGTVVGWFWAKMLMVVLLTAFAVVALLAVRRDQQIPCNCLGADDSEYLSRSTVASNGVLIVLVGWVATLPGLTASPPSRLFGAVGLVTFLALRKVLNNQRELEGMT